MTPDDNAITEQRADVDPAGGGHLPIEVVDHGRSGALEQIYQQQHLWNARHVAARCRNREAKLIAEGNHNIDYELRGLAMMAVVSAAGFVESFINGYSLRLSTRSQ